MAADEQEIFYIAQQILEKLTRMGKWGGAHTELRNITKGLPSRYTNSKQGQKLVAAAIKELRNKEFLLEKPSTGEIHVALNPRKAKEIQEIINKS